MTRRIPSPATIVIPDQREFSSTLNVIAGNATNSGLWFDIASEHNLNQAMMHAQPTHEQSWTDSSYNLSVAGPAWTFGYDVRFPKLTDKHTNLTCTVFGKFGAGLGLGSVRFTALTSGSTAIVTLPAADAWTAAATKLSVVGSFGVNDYETLIVETMDDVEIEVIVVEYDEIRPLGLYPAADDELAAGVANLIDGVPPLDTDELAADSPGCSEFAQTLDAGVAACSARQRVYISMGSNHRSGGLPIGFPPAPFRVMVPVHGNGPHTLTFWLKGAAQAFDVTHLIQHTGRATIEGGYDYWNSNRIPAGFTGATILSAGAATQWVTGTITLHPELLLGAPGAYTPGFAQLVIYPRTELLSFSAWGT